MRTSVLLIASAMLIAAPAVAQGNSGKQKGPPAATAPAAASFGSSSEREIRDYFRLHPMPVQGLPPGIAKNLARGKPLPPGIAKRALPSDLVTRLPTYSGYEVVVVDRDVMLINLATQVIVDILSDVF